MKAFKAYLDISQRIAYLENELEQLKKEREAFKKSLYKYNPNNAKYKVAEKIILEGKKDLKSIARELCYSYSQVKRASAEITKEIKKLNSEDNPL